MKAFMKKEMTQIIEAKLKTKTRVILETSISEDFNGCHMTIKAESIIVVQKDQAKKLMLVDIKDNTKKQ